MPYKLSPSRLGMLSECKRCFWLHFNEDIKRPRGPFPSLPSGVDKILKEHFDIYREKEELPPELNELDNDVELFQDMKLLKRWRNNFRGIRWQDEDGNVFMGAVDSVLNKDGELIVLDYKTRGYPLKEDTTDYYKDQLDIYNLLLRKEGWDTKDYSYLLFYHPDKVNGHGDILFHTELIEMPVNIENAERIFQEALEVLDGEMPKPSEECDYCSWAQNWN